MKPHQIIESAFTRYNVPAKHALVKNNKRKGYSRAYYQDIVKARCLALATLSQYPEWSTRTLMELFGFTRNTVITSVQRGRSLMGVVIIITLLSCERIPPPQNDIRYSGTITYSLPSINETTPASRTFRNDSVIWWQAPNVSGQCIVNSNCYQVNGITIFASSSCVDSIAIVHTGTGEFIPDSLIESGTVVYYRRSGTIEETEVGTYTFKGKKQ